MDTNTLLNCHKRIAPFIHRTPVLTSSLLNDMCNAQLFFKCENFQKMGAFKMRGATNAIMQLGESKRAKGVVTHSSGNFAQALALAARSLGVKATIVMPENAPEVKVRAVEAYGGIIIPSESTIEAREKASNKIVGESGASFIHPSNDLDVIIGNSTASIEFLQDYPDLDYIIASVGGGGLIAGTAIAAAIFGNHCKVIGAEPKNVDDAFRSFNSGTIEKNISTNTIADGLRTHLGTINFPIIQKYVERIITVEEDEIIYAMKLIYERLKIVVEPSSAVALAIVLKEKDTFEQQRVGIIMSGGNVDLRTLPFNF